MEMDTNYHERLPTPPKSACYDLSQQIMDRLEGRAELSRRGYFACQEKLKVVSHLLNRFI
jgi:hypothetical protein